MAYPAQPPAIPPIEVAVPAEVRVVSEGPSFAEVPNEVLDQVPDVSVEVPKIPDVPVESFAIDSEGVALDLEPVERQLDAVPVEAEPVLEAPTPPSNPVEETGDRPSLEVPGETGIEGPLLQQALDEAGVVALTADYQSFDQQKQVVIAEGNVEMRFQGGLLSGDRVQINLTRRIVVADGEAALVRGQQRLRGDRIEYNITQETGRVLAASGTLYSPSSGPDLDFDQGGTEGGFVAPPSDRLTQTEPTRNVTNPGAITIVTGFQTNFSSFRDENEDNPDSSAIKPSDTIALPLQVSGFRQEGEVNRWRFEADELRLVPGGWEADTVNLTNDPFSPPQFKLRAESVRVRALSPLVDEIVAEKPRYVFEDKVAIPTFRNRIVIDRRPRDDGLVTFGFDGRDRGGLFAERSFEPISTDKLRINLTPQFYLQRALFEEGGNVFSPKNYGLRADVRANLRPGTTFTGNATFTTADPSELGDKTRARALLRQNLGRHLLDLDYTYRGRIYNGSLGFRTVQQSYGAVLQSPNFVLGKTGIVANYQAGVQRITADTDRADLLDPIRENNRVTLNRYQLGASLNRGFSLWRGQALPATPDQGLRYTPVPITPNVSTFAGITGLYSAYGNGETQESLTTTLGLNGEFGHFSKKWLDYTAVNVVYSQAIRGDESPFQFDRIADTQVLSLGLRQQVYGSATVRCPDQPEPQRSRSSQHQLHSGMEPPRLRSLISIQSSSRSGLCFLPD